MFYPLKTSLKKSKNKTALKTALLRGGRVIDIGYTFSWMSNKKTRSLQLHRGIGTKNIFFVLKCK